MSSLAQHRTGILTADRPGRRLKLWPGKERAYHGNPADTASENSSFKLTPKKRIYPSLVYPLNLRNHISLRWHYPNQVLRSGPYQPPLSLLRQAPSSLFGYSYYTRKLFLCNRNIILQIPDTPLSILHSSPG